MTTPKRLFSVLLAALLIAVGAVGCTDVGVNPKDTTTSEKVFSEAKGIRAFLGKLYGGLAVTGQEGPAGDADISQIDEGFSQYIRLWWQMQELPTDEAVIAWNDLSVQDLNKQTWSDENGFSSAMYARVFFQVSQVNEFLRQSSPEQLQANGIDPATRERAKQWRAEARFLRALSYWHAIDLFGRVPLVTQENPIGTGEGESAPEMASRAELYNFIESELRAITDNEGEETLPPVGQAEYGRADKGAAYMVLAKLYQNARVYLTNSNQDPGQADLSVLEPSSPSEGVINALEPVLNAYGTDESAIEEDYHDLFLADNHTAKGVIFAVPQDGQRTQSFGNTTFLVNASTGGSMPNGALGIPSGGWAGLRTTPETVDRFEAADTRPVFENVDSTQFFRTDQSKEIETLTEFGQGYTVPKYQNVTSTGELGQNDLFPDTDYPMFRLADAWLMYAEAVARGGGGSASTAEQVVNALRSRAGLGEVSQSTVMNPEFYLDARHRELFWEATRRTDLIRFGEFTGGDYTWTFKGGEAGGRATESKYKLYPIPASEIQANPNLTQDDQNPGYGG